MSGYFAQCLSMIDEDFGKHRSRHHGLSLCEKPYPSMAAMDGNLSVNETLKYFDLFQLATEACEVNPSIHPL